MRVQSTIVIEILRVPYASADIAIVTKPVENDNLPSPTTRLGANEGLVPESTSGFLTSIGVFGNIHDTVGNNC